jgi:SAM-dependent MidA family methyltransferase
LFYKFDPIITNDYRIPDGNYSLIWIDDLKQLHSHNTYFIANELFDAYPIHKFQVKNSSVPKKLYKIIFFCYNLKKTAQGWKEVLIDWNPKTKQLQYILSPRQTIMSRLYENVCFMIMSFYSLLSFF